jgi:hypothetical protein
MNSRVMTALNLRKLLALIIAELDGLRQRYEALGLTTADTRLAMLAGFLAHREVRTIAALRRYCEHDEHYAALEVHVRLGWGYPFTGRSNWPRNPGIDDLIELAEESDKALAGLRERVELYAASRELHESLEALDAIVRARRHELASALQELGEGSEGPRGAGGKSEALASEEVQVDPPGPAQTERASIVVMMSRFDTDAGS